jgi:hypothetical protein
MWVCDYSIFNYYNYRAWEMIHVPLNLNHWDELLVKKEVKEFFNNDQKTELWFQTPNPNLGNSKPIDLVNAGRSGKLRAFIKEALSGNNPGEL